MDLHVLPGTIVTLKPARSAAYCSRLIADPSFSIPPAVVTESPLINAVFALLFATAVAGIIAEAGTATAASAAPASKQRRSVFLIPSME
jgi:hypothetical protein